MFTIKIVHPDGVQHVHETDNCTYTPTDQGGIIEYTTPSGEKFIIDNADVYLMNANGKTVADYYVRHTPPSIEATTK